MAAHEDLEATELPPESTSWMPAILADALNACGRSMIAYGEAMLDLMIGPPGVDRRRLIARARAALATFEEHRTQALSLLRRATESNASPSHARDLERFVVRLAELASEIADEREKLDALDAS